MFFTFKLLKLRSDLKSHSEIAPSPYIRVLHYTAKPFKMPIDVTECKYTLGCITMFNDRKFNQNSESFHFGEFKVHIDYTVTYFKAFQHIQIDETEDTIGHEDDDL